MAAAMLSTRIAFPQAVSRRDCGNQFNQVSTSKLFADDREEAEAEEANNNSTKNNTHTYRPNSIRLFEILIASNKIVNMRNIDIVIAHRHL